MSKENLVIIEVKTKKANLKALNQEVGDQTGDYNPFWCPNLIDGQPYDGHAHATPPAGVSNPSNAPIKLN